MKHDEVRLIRNANYHLKELGVAPGLVGYKYIQTAMKLANEDNTIISDLTSRLYPEIAKIHGIKPANVERGIRHAIEAAFKIDNEEAADALYRYFGNTISKGKGKVTNSVFLATLFDEIDLDLQEEHINDTLIRYKDLGGNHELR